MKRKARTLLCGWGALFLTACSSVPSTDIVQPVSVRAPERPITTRPSNGGIFHAQASMSSLFEDSRPRYLGDILTVQINENTNAARNSSTSASRVSSQSTSVTALTNTGVNAVGRALGMNGFPLPTVDGSSTSSLDGEGEVEASDVFTGTITVTVVDVLPNGNLQISGEKIMALGNNKEHLRISGVVDPKKITATNTISSTQIADARIEYKGTGTIRDVQEMGWLQRFFLSVMPF